jgi:formiminoglutamate deiminase
VTEAADVYWCELAWLGGERAEAGVLLTVDDGTFAVVEPGADAPPDATRLAGLTLPGFANAHSHAFHRALRGRTQAGRGSFWTWREQMYALAATLDPDTYFRLARATYAEMALAGITAVGEFHYLHHEPAGHRYNDPNEMGQALIAAANEAGIRMTLLDTCYLHGGFGEPPDDVQKRFSDGDADGWAERVDMLATVPDARIGGAIHSVRAVDPAACATVAAWAAAGDRPLHAHVSEQPAENQGCLAAHGQTPSGVLADAGALGPRFTAVHATHLTDGDVRLLGGAGCCCCFCPTTERDLADGVGPARALIDAGASLSLGSDSHAVIDLLEEARAVELDERLSSGERGHHDAASLLRAATAGGHAAIGSPGGRLESGARADLVTVGLDSVRLAGVTAEAALAAVVFAANSADVREVVVAGRRVVTDGKHADLDVAAELRTAIAEAHA